MGSFMRVELEVSFRSSNQRDPFSLAETRMYVE